MAVFIKPFLEPWSFDGHCTFFMSDQSASFWTTEAGNKTCSKEITVRLHTFRINPTRNSGLIFGGSFSRVSHVKFKKKKKVITCKGCLICSNICRIRPCVVLLMPEDYIMFFWLSFCSNNIKPNTFFMSQVTLCFPTVHKKKTFNKFDW